MNNDGTFVSSVTNYISETAWSGSNGGYSTYFKRPIFQNGIQTNTFRGTPDISANADPKSGYLICYNRTCKKVGGIRKTNLYRP